MDVSSYLNHIIPLDWWRTELQDHHHDHAGPASILLATSMLVSYVWGKYTAIGFLIIAFVTYPLSHKQVKYFMFLEAYGTVQAIACVAIPVVCSKAPLLSAWSTPLHVALAYSIITREWRLCQAFGNTSKEISRLQQLNKELNEQVSNLQANSLKLKDAILQLTTQFEKKKQLALQSHDIAQKGEETAIQHGVDFNRLNQQLEQLTKACLIAAQTNGLHEHLKKVDTYEQRLQELTSSCESKNQELSRLIQSIEKLKEELSEVLNRAINEEMKTQQGLEMVQNWLSAIVNRVI